MDENGKQRLRDDWTQRVALKIQRDQREKEEGINRGSQPPTVKNLTTNSGRTGMPGDSAVFNPEQYAHEPTIIKNQMEHNKFEKGENGLVEIKISGKENVSFPDWEENKLPENEWKQFYQIKQKWEAANRVGDLDKMKQAHMEAENIRAKYRMPYEYTDESGITRLDISKYNEFIEQAMIKNGTEANGVPGYVIAGAIASQLDSPAPGPGDVVGLLIIAGGFIISQAIAYFASGKNNPHDLEKGMSANQKGKYQREIENFKKGGGMQPNFNLPWEILVELAEEIKKRYR